MLYGQFLTRTNLLTFVHKIGYFKAIAMLAVSPLQFLNQATNFYEISYGLHVN